MITDASEVELGAILCQGLGNIGQLVFPINVSCCCCYYYYVSSKLLPRELRYSVTKRAHLAGKMGSRSMMILSLSNEFTFMTDHYPLLWLNRMKDMSTRITWWYLEFIDLKFLSWKNGVAVRLSLCECCRGGQRGRRSHFLCGNGKGRW